MSAVGAKKTVTISPELHTKIGSLRKGNQTYGDVVEFAISKLIQTDSLISEVFKSLSTIGDYPLKKPMSFSVYFDSEDDVWCVENTDLSILGTGYTYDEIVSSLEDEIDSYVVGYLLTDSDIPLSPSSLDLKKKLDEYIDFSVSLSVYKSKYGDD